MEYFSMELTHYKHPKWAIDRVERRLSKPTNEGINDDDTQDTASTKSTTNKVKTKGHIVIPSLNHNIRFSHLQQRNSDQQRSAVEKTQMLHNR